MKKTILFFLLLLLNRTGNSQVNDFKLCGDQKTHPYYYPELSYKGGFYEVKSQILIKLNQTFLNNNINGIITIQFHVNCEGQTGDFNVKQTDLDYKDTVLDEKLSQHILEIVKNLTDWIPAKNENGEIVNSHKFLSFRIENGVLTEILPK
jgi:hypothetical protein